MATDVVLAELEQNFRAVADALFTSPTTPVDTLQRIVAVAVGTIDGCDAAGILQSSDAEPVTAAATAPVVHELHRLQVAARSGPCFEALATRSPASSADLATGDGPWPAFAEAAVQLGIRSVLAFPFPRADGPASALNLYAELPAAFGATDRAKGLLLATLAGVAFDAANVLEHETRRTQNLLEALQTRELIGQAQGILMERERITADQAFALLRHSSQHLNVKLREVARTLVETGETPVTGPPSA